MSEFLNERLGQVVFLVFPENKTSWVGFALWGLQCSFHIYAWFCILIRSLLSLDTKSSMLSTTENIGAISK